MNNVWERFEVIKRERPQTTLRILLEEKVFTKAEVAYIAATQATPFATHPQESSVGTGIVLGLLLGRM